MSGVFNPNEPGIHSTDDEDVARAHGLLYLDPETGQYRKPNKDAGESENAPFMTQTQQHSDVPRDDVEQHTPGASPLAEGTQGDEVERSQAEGADTDVVGAGAVPLGDETRPVAEGKDDQADDSDNERTVAKTSGRGGRTQRKIEDSDDSDDSK